MEYNKKQQKKPMSYCLKKVLKAIFKKQNYEQKTKRIVCKQPSLESLECLENVSNAEVEIQSENDANERIYAASSSGSNLQSEDQYDDATIYVPVHFVRTGHGTFFWTGVPDTAPDADLMEPLDCQTENQIAIPQFRGHRVQA